MITGEPPRKRMLHTCADIQWAICDGCEYLEVIDLTNRKLFERHQERPYEYKCHANAKNPTMTRKQIYDVTSETCPIGKEPKRRHLR